MEERRNVILKNFLNKNKALNLPLPSDENEEVAIVQWDNFYDDQIVLSNGMSLYRAGTEGPVVFLIHGAGHTAMSWALVGERMKGVCQVYAIDVRGHGESEQMDMDDMSAERLVDDVIFAVEELFPEGKPMMVFIGHSMGGSIAIRSAARLQDNISALIVLDAVEGTAISSLPKMMSILQSRPTNFEDYSEAVTWAIRTGVIRKRDSARVSMPPQLKEDTLRGGLTWRTNLANTQNYWKGWFEGMSEAFLSVYAPKLLIIADTDRLDTPLTIAQMQGKYQMSVFPNVGHLIQEDDPVRTAETILTFLKRFGIVEEDQTS